MDLGKQPQDRPVSDGEGSKTVAMIAIAAILAVAVILFLALRGGDTTAPATPVKDGGTVVMRKPAPAQVQEARVSAPATPATYLRVEWYEPFDPKQSGEIYGRVEDQYGCWWWTRISSGKYESSERAYRKDGYPDCPANAMPKPYLEFLQGGDRELRSGITVVSKREVKAGDPELVRFFRQRRDDVAVAYR